MTTTSSFGGRSSVEVLQIVLARAADDDGALRGKLRVERFHAGDEIRDDRRGILRTGKALLYVELSPPAIGRDGCACCAGMVEVDSKVIPARPDAEVLSAPGLLGSLPIQPVKRAVLPDIAPHHHRMPAPLP